MKVQAGVARMLINTSSKIAQIARSRPIPFDVPCKRYEREPFFIEIRAAIWRVTCTRVTYTNARSECIIVQKKENDGKEKMERERVETGKSNEERESQAESQSNFSNLSNLCRMQNQSRSTLPYRPPQEPWGPYNFQIYP